MRRLSGLGAAVLLLAGSGILLTTIAPAGPTRAATVQGDSGQTPEDRGDTGGRIALRARFAPAAAVPLSVVSSLVPVPPTFEGKVQPQRRGEMPVPASTQATPSEAAPEAVPAPEAGPPVVTAGTDVFVADGSETALAVNIADGNNLVGALNAGFANTTGFLTSSNGGASWIGGTFPNGAGTITGYPFDPWASGGIAGGELFASFIRRDSTVGSIITHVVLARSGNRGGSWSRLFEAAQSLQEDRDMFDVDRTTAQGGGTGTAHDGKIYVAYDGFSATIPNSYVASYLEVASPTGALLARVVTSRPQPQFNGTQMQPVAGTTDGQVYLMSVATNQAGDGTILLFHEVTGAGAVFTPQKSYLAFWNTGQKLGTSTRWGLNGHRIGAQQQMDIDRSSGPRRGHLYVLSSRNPNPTDPTKDQGDIWLSISTDGALSWTEAVIPGPAAGKTQFFAMLDVDDDGWIHVAYYQNETGSTNNGVVNASTANLYYTVSTDGGLTWAPPTQVNGAGDTLNYFDPPPDLSTQDFYLIGDYAQVRAATVGGSKVAYVLWTGYDKNRDDIHLFNKRERAIATMLTLAVDTDGDGFIDPLDNCPTIYNPGQEDLNHNGIGDICECFLNRANVDDTSSSQGRIDGSDLFPLARAFGSCTGSPAYNSLVDLSPQGCVDGYDLALLASVWAEPVPAVCP